MSRLMALVCFGFTMSTLTGCVVSPDGAYVEPAVGVVAPAYYYDEPYYYGGYYYNHGYHHDHYYHH